jgi:hypothetical protein
MQIGIYILGSNPIFLVLYCVEDLDPVIPGTGTVANHAQ